MNAYWQTVCTKFEALNARERYFVAGGVLVLLYALIHVLMLAPLAERNKMLRAALAADQSQLQTIRAQLAVYGQQSVIDPNALSKQRLLALQLRLQRQETELIALHAALVTPENMPDLLRSLLTQNSKLTLIALKTLPAQHLLDHALATSSRDESAADATSLAASSTGVEDAPVFKHDVEITVEGHYLDLLAYVTALEKMPWHVLWSHAVLQVDEHATTQRPLSQLKLTVYTLSLDPAWLSI